MRMKFKQAVTSIGLFIRTVAMLHIAFSCVLKCGVDHSGRRTSASLIYERFHGP